MSGPNDKVVVITGASAGIGEAAAKILSARGLSVVLVARRKDKIEALAVPADAGVRTDVRRVVDAAIQRFGRIDVWINNVGRGIT